jgi:hypothetical protein
MVVLISRRPEGSSKAARHTHLGRSSIEPTTILLRKQKYRVIGIGQFYMQSLAGANKRHQVVEGGRGVIVEGGGAKLGAEPSDTGSGFILYRRLQGHRSTVVGESLATQKTTNCPLIEGVTVAM